MLSGVPRILTLCAVAVVAFFAGEKLESLLMGTGKARPAHAEALAPSNDPAKPAKRAMLGDQKPTLRLSSRMDKAVDAKAPALPVVAPAPTEPADVKASTASTASDKPAESGAVDAASPAAASAPGDATAEAQKPTMQSGKDEDGQTDFVELKNLPEVSGQGAGAGSARDVDVLGDQGVALPDVPSDQATSDASTKSDN